MYDDFCAVIKQLTHGRQGFDYNYHNRLRPQQKGLYAFWLDTGACLYVGQSKDLRNRFYQHRMHETNEELESYFQAFSRRIEASYAKLNDDAEDALDGWEREAIAVLRPNTNKVHRSSWGGA